MRMRAAAAVLLAVAAIGVSPSGAHGTSCAGHEHVAYNQTFLTATFEFDLDRCTGAGSMDLELTVARESDPPQTSAVQCAPDTLCRAAVQVRHLPIERARYVVSWRYESHGAVHVHEEDRVILDCTSILVRHGCPLELTP